MVYSVDNETYLNVASMEAPTIKEIKNNYAT